jgi:TonB-linked SusC/RagA family outer membrane protein
MLLTFSAAAQSMLKISGTVLDESSEPAVGVSVVVKGTTTGAVTDVNGGYDIQAPADGVLRFSFVGMADVEEPINGRGRIDVTLANAANNLDEVVVIGYGTVRKRDLTGAVSSVGGKDVAAVPVSSAAEAITGKMAGVQVTTTEGSPDAEVKIRVRGGGSITQSSNPLYIVDGFPVSSINDIAPGDIQSMDVLKDASSAAIYGARGANGVVIITTKSGQEGKLTVNYNAYYGWKKIAKTLDVISPYDYALWSYERSLLADDDKYARYFGNWEDIDMYDGIAFNDWQDIIFGNVGTTFNHNLSISGGTEKSKYAFSYNHIDDEAIAKGSNYARDNLALKLTSNPHKRVQLDFSVRWAKTGVNGPITNDGGEEKGSTSDTRLKSVMIYPSIPLTAKELTDPSETDPDFALYSPTVSLRDNERVNNRKTLNMGGAASWEFIDGFKLKTEVGLDQYDERNDRFYGVTTYYSRMTVPGNDNKGKPAVIFTDRNRETLRNTNTLNMDFNTFLPKDHSLSLLLGQEYLITTSHTMESLGAGFDYSFNLDMARRLTTEGNGGEYYPAVNNSFSPDDKLFSWFGRTNYSYQGKYLASATFRADGSSKFASGNRWGLFPSVSAAWRISAEPFMEGTNKWLNDLKLRASYGTAGNNNIPAGQMTQTYQASGTSWVGGYSSYWAPSKIMANPDLTWETTITRNVGVDWSLLNGSLSGTVEAYLNSTKDLLLLFPTPGTGYDNQYRNMGETENQGLEISANWAAVSKKNFTVSVSANIGFNKNKVVSLGDMEEVTGATEWSSTEVGTDYMVRIGQPIGQMYGYRAAGRYEVSDFDYVDGKWRLKDGVVNCSDVIGANQLRPGAMKLEDIDGDHKVTSDNDRVVIGNANPLHTGGFSVNVRAYGFDLGAYFNWSYGNDVYNANKIEYTSTSKFHSRNMIDIMADGSRWTNLDKTTGQLITDPAALEAANANTTMWSPWMSKYVLTDWAVEDGSFLRLNTLTLGYTLPRSLTERVKLSATRFYVSAYNVFCLTGYSGFDPEVDTRRKVPYTPGVDYAAYPRSRQVVVGLNLTF